MMGVVHSPTHPLVCTPPAPLFRTKGGRQTLGEGAHRALEDGCMQAPFCSPSSRCTPICKRMGWGRAANGAHSLCMASHSCAGKGCEHDPTYRPACTTLHTPPFRCHPAVPHVGQHVQDTQMVGCAHVMRQHAGSCSHAMGGAEGKLHSPVCISPSGSTLEKL